MSFFSITRYPMILKIFWVLLESTGSGRISGTRQTGKIDLYSKTSKTITDDDGGWLWRALSALWTNPPTQPPPILTTPLVCCDIEGRNKSSGGGLQCSLHPQHQHQHQGHLKNWKAMSHNHCCSLLPRSKSTMRKTFVLRDNWMYQIG